MTQARSKAAFTLIELMVAVAIMGVLAAIAVPSFIGYVRRSRTAEAVQTLGGLYSAASALYAAEHSGRQVTSTVVTACVAEPNALVPTPKTEKQRFPGGPGFDQLAFKMADLVIYGYGISSIGNPGGITCFSNPTSINGIYTFFARGDLDGDTTYSTFELAIGSNGAGELYHSRGLYIVMEME